MTDSTRRPNRLIDETSPYLKQHAYNPVDWFPWGPEALAESKRLDRPIFLSIGYSACHWCHVMEHESFEDPEVGALLKEHFISVKVDREERPDLDQIYMAAVQLLTQRGGWPMSVFLTPDLKPFFGGTYFPPDDRHGMPSFRRLVTALADAWKNRRGEIDASSGQIGTAIQESMQIASPSRSGREVGGEDGLTADLLRGATRMLERAFDSRHGGFGAAPKFPHPMELRLLLRIAKRFGDQAALNMAQKTLHEMAMGGMYDQLGGGFHRYSTDERWLVPHFEKMLYDNALLTMAYLEAYQVTGIAYYRQITEETLAYVLREMTSPQGAFYSTQDADSEGVEGKFFVWTVKEIEAILGLDDGKLFCSIYDVTSLGNWEGHNILHLSRPLEVDAKMLALPALELQTRLMGCREKLLKIRGKRIWPARDEKILTAWNGLMIASFAKAAQVLEKPEYAQAAARASDFILTTMRKADGRLWRTTLGDAPAKLDAYLEDYAYFLDALVTLYEATFEQRWIESARSLAGVMIEQFWDDAEGGFFYTGKDHETLIARGKDPHDNATPSGNSMAVTALLRLAKLTGDKDLFDKAERTLQLFRGLMERSPMAAGQMLCALDFHLGPVKEIAVIGDADHPDVIEVLKMLRRPFRPHQVLAWANGRPESAAANALPLLKGKAARGGVTTYVCEGFVCQAPLVGAEAVRAME
ncbi:MAG: thioredoxin domain-containing protein [Planctomycetes bacterium]|nr:thioredoxin domain-containing protein [Planctomycetota bacterium]